MAKRQPPGAGRKGPESDYNREMRKAFERSNNKENRPVDNRSLIPQLMRELVEVHGVRRAVPQQQQRLQEAPAGRYRRRTPVPPRELPTTRPQIPQAGPSFQAGQRATASGSKWSEFVATRHLKARATPFPDVQVPEKDEGISVGEMTIKADVHEEGTTAMEFASGGQIPTEYPHHQATAEQFSAEPQYAVPHKKKDDDAPEVDTTESLTPSSDSSSDRPPTPHPRSWLPVAMKYLDGNYLQNIHQQQGYEDKKQQKCQHILTDEEQFQLDTQLAIQHSLQEAFIRSSDRYFGEDENMMMESQEKQVNHCDSGMSHIGLPQPTPLNMHTPVGLNAQYALRDDTVMLTAKRETKTNIVPVPVHTGPPKPARLYVRGVNAPPGMMEPISSVVPRISNVQCPPPNTNEEVWENIIPEEPARPQQDLITQQEPDSCWERFMESFMETMNAMGHCFRVLGNYTWRYLCHCEPIPGTCAYN